MYPESECKNDEPVHFRRVLCIESGFYRKTDGSTHQKRSRIQTCIHQNKMEPNRTLEIYSRTVRRQRKREGSIFRTVVLDLRIKYSINVYVNII